MEDERHSKYMSWNKQQKLAVLKSICYMVGADRKVAPQEMMVVQGFLDRYQLNMDAMNEQASMSYFEMCDSIQSMTASEKRLIVSYWKETARCDGHVDNREVECMAQLIIDCNIDESYI